jgi:nitrogen-specific signal transduction histidine kinase
VAPDEREDGAGLGPAIVRDALDGHGGRLDLATPDQPGGLKASPPALPSEDELTRSIPTKLTNR